MFSKKQILILGQPNEIKDMQLKV